MGVPIRNMIEFLALDHQSTVAQVLARRARALAVVYMVYNTVSHHPSSAPPFEVLDFINIAIARSGPAAP